MDPASSSLLLWTHNYCWAIITGNFVSSNNVSLLQGYLTKENLHYLMCVVTVDTKWCFTKLIIVLWSLMIVDWYKFTINDERDNLECFILNWQTPRLNWCVFSLWLRFFFIPHDIPEFYALVILCFACRQDTQAF